MCRQVRDRVALSLGCMAMAMTLSLAACSAPPQERGGAASVAVASPAAGTQSASAAPVVQRKIIRNAALTVSVSSVADSFKSIRGSLSKWNAYLSESRFSEQDAAHQQAILQIRVPSQSLDQVLSDISGLGKITHQAETGEDVTDQYVDLESQLRNLRMTEQRLLQLMQQTGSVTDLLEVEKEVTRTRGEIEGIQGRLQGLDNQVAFSTIDIELVEQSHVASGDFWQLGATVQNGWSMFMHVLRALITVTIYGLFLLPFMLPAWLLHLWRTRRTRDKSPDESPPKG